MRHGGIIIPNFLLNVLDTGCFSLDNWSKNVLLGTFNAAKISFQGRLSVLARSYASITHLIPDFRVDFLAFIVGKAHERFPFL